MRHSLDLLIESGQHGSGSEHRDVLETFRLFAHDRGWLRRLREAVATGLTAEAASNAFKTTRAPNCSAKPSPIFASVCMISTIFANRLLHQLTGQGFVGTHEELPAKFGYRRTLHGTCRAAGI